MIVIYKLLDPRTMHPRYVGKTCRPKDRIKSHRNPAKPIRTKCATWAMELKVLGLSPLMEIIETIPEGVKWAPREQYWIDTYKSQGFDILNLAPAGATPKEGHSVSEATREKLRQRFKGRPLPQWQRDAVSKARKGKKRSAESITKQLETRKRLYELNGPTKRSPEICARISAATKGKKKGPFTPEHRANMSAARAAWWALHSKEQRWNILSARGFDKTGTGAACPRP